ncbi:hypothetical protein G0U57_005353, partial [Chelydra serpentina]
PWSHGPPGILVGGSLHGAMSMGLYLAWFTPIPDACSFLRCEGDPGACLPAVCQVAAPFLAPPELPFELLPPTPFHLCTPCPWPHEIVGPARQPPPGAGQNSRL